MLEDFQTARLVVLHASICDMHSEHHHNPFITEMIGVLERANGDLKRDRQGAQYLITQVSHWGGET